jgi:hypothetical protein
MTKPNGLDLEKRLRSAIEGSATSAELASLISEAEGAIVAAEEEAVRMRESAFDPQLAPDPVVARDQMESASLMVVRLQTLHSRLVRRYAEADAQEQLEAWTASFYELKDRRDALAAEMAQTYPQATRDLMNLNIRIAAFDEELGRLHRARPPGLALRLDGVELTARKLDRFTREVPSLLSTIELFEFYSGKQLWPQRVLPDMAMFAPVISNAADWWRPEVQAARAAHAEAEAKRVAEYYAQQAKEREEREKTLSPSTR